MWSDDKGREQFEIREYETFTDHLLTLREWLCQRACPIIVMESTGPYWTPIHNIPENYFKVILVNPRHIKNVTGPQNGYLRGEGFSPIPRWGH